MASPPLACLATCLLLAGCTTVGPNFEKPAAWWSPSSWGHSATPAPQAASTTVAEPIDPKWWKVFNDPTLTSLETRLVTGNFDLRVSAERLAEARAQYGVAEAGLYPTLSANTNYERQQVSKRGELTLAQPSGPAFGASGSKNTAIFQPFDLYQAGFDASWEIDLWGGVRRQIESAAAQVQATEEQRRDTLVTASAELARDYVDLRGAQRKLAITQENLKSQQQSLGLTRQRAAGGLTTDLDVANAAADVSATAAQIPPLQQQIDQLTNAIALLLGEPPGTLQAELATPEAIPPVPPRVPVGLPSDLARRRPDIRRAEAQLHSTTADIGVATAAFYPSISLSGSLALQSVQFAQLFGPQAITYGLGPTLSIPLFEGGKLTRTLELKKADQREAALTYQKTVLGALHEVDNALTAYSTEQARRDQLQTAVNQNRRALSLAQERYQQGVADFLEVLIAQRGLLAAEQQLSDSTTTISTNLVQLYKSLGGGWETALPDTPPTTQQAKL